MSAGGGGGVKAEPNVTPMVDVMLVLLIIFMIIIPALTSGFNATPPSGVNIKAHPEEESDVTVGIDASGSYYLNKHPIAYDTLLATLTRIYAARPEDKIIYIRADKGLEYAKIIDIIDVASKAGAIVSGMISEQTANTQSSVPGDAPEATTPGTVVKPPGGMH
jgi:biopolymer transport protein ExbD